MKNLLKFSILCLTASILLSSCGSNMYVAKRHYTKGYYVENNKRAQNGYSAKQEQKTAVAKINLPSHSIPYKGKEAIIGGDFSKQAQQTIHSIIPLDEKMHHTAISKQGTIQAFEKTTVMESPITQNNQAVSEVSASSGNGGDAGAALSLLWVVIIIVLILWLLGLVVGIGPFINLLLVVALILLILWLLRII